jgi:hypothetical protein
MQRGAGGSLGGKYIFNKPRACRDLADLQAGFELLQKRLTRVNEPEGYLLGSYRIATAPEPNSARSNLVTVCA